MLSVKICKGIILCFTAQAIYSSEGLCLIWKHLKIQAALGIIGKQF